MDQPFLDIQYVYQRTIEDFVILFHFKLIISADIWTKSLSYFFLFKRVVKLYHSTMNPDPFLCTHDPEQKVPEVHVASNDP